MPAAFTKHYVDALFDVAGSPDAVEALLPGLTAFSALLARSEELRSVFANPGVDRPRKLAVLGKLLEGQKLGGLGTRLLATLLQNHRLHRLPEVLAAIRARLDRERRVLEASVKTAQPLTDALQKQLLSSLEKRTGGSVRLQTHVDPALLGGFSIQIGSEVYDATLAHRLEKARRALRAAAGTHGRR